MLWITVPNIASLWVTRRVRSFFPVQMWRWLGSWLSPSVAWRCTCSLTSPACLRIFSGAIFARKATVCVVMTKHGWGLFYHSLHLFTPRKINARLLLSLDFGVRFLDQILHFLYCGTRKPGFGHFCHNQGHVHFGLFQLYTTFLPCHCSRYDENLQEIGCSF